MTSWTYDATGQITRQDFENGLYTEFGYDDRGRITSNVIKNALGVPQRSESVSYNAAGRVTSRTIDGVTTSYTYDVAGNLLAESRTGYSASYTYDTSGRRTSKTLNNNTENYTYSGGRLTEVGSTTFGYDNNSRRTSMVTGSDTTSYGSDYEDRLTSVTPPGSSAITYVYNGLGSRVGRGSEEYRRAGASAGSPLLADGSASYTPGLSERRGGQSSFFHWGSFGDLLAVSGGSGSLSDLYSYDWFLGVVGHTGSSTTPVGAGGGYVDPDTGGINHGGGGEYEPWLGGGPSVAQMIMPDNGNINYGPPLGFTNSLISEYMHIVLDVVGIFDPTPFCDGINTFWYLAEGDYSNAGISAIGIVPFVGDLAKVGRLAKLVDGASPGVIVIGENMERVRDAARALDAAVYNPGIQFGYNEWGFSMLHNQAWIRDRIAEGWEFVSIGVDTSRPNRSAWFAMELDELTNAGVSPLGMYWPSHQYHISMGH